MGERCKRESVSDVMLGLRVRSLEMAFKPLTPIWLPGRPNVTMNMICLRKKPFDEYQKNEP